MRKTALALALVMAVPLVPGAAGAAVPRNAFEYAMGCSNDNWGVKWWAKRRSALQNDCKEQWVIITNYRDGTQTKVVNVAPGAHFNWSRRRLALPQPRPDERAEMTVSPGPRRCADPGAVSLAIHRGSRGKAVRLDCPDDYPR